MKKRELLALAAKAAGIEHWQDRTDSGLSITLPDGRHDYLPKWNPLDDDGDALRLAVKLEMRIDQMYCDSPRVMAGYADCWGIEKYNGDRLKATRRAIVKAAAEIGLFKATPNELEGE